MKRVNAAVSVQYIEKESISIKQDNPTVVASYFTKKFAACSATQRKVVLEGLVTKKYEEFYKRDSQSAMLHDAGKRMSDLQAGMQEECWKALILSLGKEGLEFLARVIVQKSKRPDAFHEKENLAPPSPLRDTLFTDLEKITQKVDCADKRVLALFKKHFRRCNHELQSDILSQITHKFYEEEGGIAELKEAYALAKTLNNHHEAKYFEAFVAGLDKKSCDTIVRIIRNRKASSLPQTLTHCASESDLEDYLGPADLSFDDENSQIFLDDSTRALNEVMTMLLPETSLL